MKRVRIILKGTALVLAAAFLFVFFAGCANKNEADKKDQEFVGNLVRAYMTDLKEMNFASIIASSGIHVDDAVKKQVSGILKNSITANADVGIKSFEINEVRVEGSIAFVKVTETRRISPSNAAMVPGIDTKYKSVQETIVCIKRDKTWKIDAANTLHLSQFKFEDPEKLTEQANDLGLGRIFTILADPDILSPALYGFINTANVQKRKLPSEQKEKPMDSPGNNE